MRHIKRRQVYDEDYNEIVAWGILKVSTYEIQRPPNGKNNFPYYLEQYLQELRSKCNQVTRFDKQSTSNYN